MIKVLTPQQLKEHNKLLQEQLLLDKENEEEETEDYQERLNDGAERIASIGDTISTLQETIESVVRKDDINELKNTMQNISNGITKTKTEINKSMESKSNIKHTHTMAGIEGLIDELDGLQIQLDNTTKTINNELDSKLDKGYKTQVEDIIGLKEELNKLYEKIQSIKIPEVDLSDYYKKEEVYNKDETYNKKEVDQKLVRVSDGKGGYNYINDNITDDFFTRSSTKISEQISAAVGLYTTVGIIGSGATYECDGVADQVQMQAAITALTATGGTIYLLQGDYNRSATVILYSNIKLLCSDAAFVQFGDDDNIIRNNSGADNFSIEGGNFDHGGATAGDTHALRFDVFTNLTLTGVKITNSSHHGFWFRNGTHLKITGCTSDGTGIGSYDGCGIVAETIVDGIIIGNTILDSGYHGIQLHGTCDGCTIADNYIDDTGNVNTAGAGINIQLINTNTSITGNIILDTPTIGMSIQDSLNTTVLGNSIYTGATNSGIITTSNFGLTITGNTIRGCNNGLKSTSDEGVVVSGNNMKDITGHGVRFLLSHYINVTGNTMTGMAGGSTAGIVVETATTGDINITGNFIQGARYLARFYAGTDNINATGNFAKVTSLTTPIRNDSGGTNVTASSTTNICYL